jgi:endonuclease/exonuclease/phosphatase family metal-dependent hydrolase
LYYFYTYTFYFVLYFSSAVKRVDFVSNRVSYIDLRGRWCNIIVLNVQAPSEEKSDESKDMKILLGDFNAKVGRETTFKPTIGNKSLHQDSNDNGVRIVNFATSKNLVFKSTMFQHRNIHKYTWTSPDRQTHNQIDHILIDRRRHSSILDVRNFRGTDCDTDHYLVVANLGKDWR